MEKCIRKRLICLMSRSKNLFLQEYIEKWRQYFDRKSLDFSWQWPTIYWRILMNFGLFFMEYEHIYLWELSRKTARKSSEEIRARKIGILPPLSDYCPSIFLQNPFVFRDRNSLTYKIYSGYKPVGGHIFPPDQMNTVIYFVLNCSEIIDINSTSLGVPRRSKHWSFIRNRLNSFSIRTNIWEVHGYVWHQTLLSYRVFRLIIWYKCFYFLTIFQKNRQSALVTIQL